MSNSYNQKPLLGKIGDKLQKYIDQFTRLQNENKIYDENAKIFDISKIIDDESLANILQSTATGSNMYSGETMFEKFFDLSMGRASRYSEYEQIICRIPEVAQSLQIYVDSILAPNVGDSENQILYNTDRDTATSSQAKKLIKLIMNRTNFYKILPQIIYTQLTYGDCFVELEPTSSGIRYIIHPPKNCSLVYDSKTDIELGLIIETQQSDSKIIDMLSSAFPQINIPAPNQMISIVSDKKYLSDKKNKFQIASMEKQMTELLSDIFKDRGTKFKYLAPHRYVKFPIYYNNMYYPYGTSILDPVRSIAKQLLLIESSLAVYRATRTPVRAMWTLEVAGIPADEIPSIMRGVMQRVRRQRIFDNEGNSSSPTINTIPDFMSFEDDVWVTSIDGVKNLSYDNLQIPDITPYTNDAEYFRKKLISSLGIPPSYLAEETGGSTRALLTLEDIRFSRTIKKYQTDINNSLQELINTCFILINQAQFVDMVNISLPEPTSVETNLKIENLKNKLDTASSFMDSWPNIPKLWVMKNLLGFTQDDIDDMEKTMAEQEKYKLFVEQTPGKMTGDNQMGGIGGGPSLGGGFDTGGIGDLGMDEEMPADNEQNQMSEGPMGNIDLNTLGTAGEEMTSPNEELSNEINEINKTK